jgi:hypothetical protein
MSTSTRRASSTGCPQGRLGSYSSTILPRSYRTALRLMSRLMMIAGLVCIADEGSVDIYCPRYYTMHLDRFLYG